MDKDCFPPDRYVHERVRRIKRRIKKMRRDNHITVKDMARRLQITERSYSDKENPLKPAEFKLSELLMIAKTIDTMPGILIAEYFSPSMIADIFEVLEGVQRIEPVVSRIQNGFQEADGAEALEDVQEQFIEQEKYGLEYLK